MSEYLSCNFCARILTESERICPSCGKTTPDVLPPGEKAYGFDVWYERKTGMLSSEVVRFKKRGSKGQVVSYAKFKPGFVRIVQMSPYTKKQWVDTYGEGRM